MAAYLVPLQIFQHVFVHSQLSCHTAQTIKSMQQILSANSIQTRLLLAVSSKTKSNLRASLSTKFQAKDKHKIEDVAWKYHVIIF